MRRGFRYRCCSALAILLTLLPTLLTALTRPVLLLLLAWLLLSATLLLAALLLAALLLLTRILVGILIHRVSFQLFALPARTIDQRSSITFSSRQNRAVFGNRSIGSGVPSGDAGHKH